MQKSPFKSMTLAKNDPNEYLEKFEAKVELIPIAKLIGICKILLLFS